MTDYALVGPANEIKFIQSAPFDVTRAGWRGLPITGAQPAYDPTTQVLEGPTYTVNPADVSRVWVVRSKTAGELDTEHTSIADRLLSDPLMKALTLALFQTNNDVRVLKGQAAFTPAQFKNYLKGLM